MRHVPARYEALVLSQPQQKWLAPVTRSSRTARRAFDPV